MFVVAICGNVAIPSFLSLGQGFAGLQRQPGQVSGLFSETAWARLNGFFLPHVGDTILGDNVYTPQRVNLCQAKARMLNW